MSGKVKPESARHSAKALADIDAGWVQPAHVDPLVVEGEAKAIFRVIFAPTPCRMMKPAFVNTAVAFRAAQECQKGGSVRLAVANAERIITVLGEKGVKLIQEDGQGVGVRFATLPEPDTAS